MPAAKKHATFAYASLALMAALALAGSAGGIGLPRKNDRVAPSAPANLRVTLTTPTAVSLAWNRATDNVGVAFYDVQFDGQRTRASGTRYTATNLECGESISVRVVARDRSLNRSAPAAAMVSTAACPDSRAPTGPRDFRQAATTQDSVILEWAASSDDTGVVAYGVYRNQLPVQSPSQPTTTFTGLSCGSTIEVQVDALDAAGNRSERRSVWVQTASCASARASTSSLISSAPSADAVAPSQPTALSFGSVSETDVLLTWNPAADNVGVVGYDVYRNGTKVATVTVTSFTQDGLLCDSSYWFGVEAVDAAGNRSERMRVNPTTAPCASTNDKTSPTQPENLAVRSVTQTSVALTWSPSADNVAVLGYDAYRNGKRIVSVYSTSFTHGGLLCGTSYWFGVSARDSSGNRSQRARVPATTSPCASPPPAPPPPSPPPDDPADQTAPTQPSTLAVGGVTTASVALTWDPSTDDVGVSSYRVYVNGTGVADPTQPGATVPGLACGTAFTFEVDAADAAGNRSSRARVTASTAPCADTQAPSTPSGLAASSRTATSIALTWTASTDNVGVTSYGLYRGGTSVGSSATTTGIFSGLVCNRNYTLAVDAQDAAGNRSPSVTVMVATTACPDTAAPSAPTGLAVSNVTQSSVSVSWQASTDNVSVVGYDVYRNGTKTAALVTSISSTQSGLACGTSYWFGVEALDGAGNRSTRASINATTTGCPQPPPPPPPPPPPSPSVTPPAPPSAYSLPPAAVRVSTSAQFAAALAQSAPTDIVLAPGIYDNAGPFQNGSGHRIYSESLGGAVLKAGIVVGGNYSSGGAVLRGLSFDVRDASKTLHGGIIHVWGSAGANAQIVDCKLEGNWLIAYGVDARNPQGLVVERSEFRHFTDVGLRASDNVQVPYGVATKHISKIYDIYVDGVSRTPPGESNGTAEAGIWIGHPVDGGVRRIKIKDVSRKAIETVNNSRDTTFTDLDLDMRGTHQNIGVGVYMEHNAYYNVFDRFVMIGIGHAGFKGEWHENIPGNAGAQHITIKNGIIDAEGWLLGGNTIGVYLDEGSDSNTVTGVTFKNQNWAGIGAYKNIGTNSFTSNTFQMLPGAKELSTNHYSGAP